MVGIFGSNNGSGARTITLFNIDSSLLQSSMNVRLNQQALSQVASTSATAAGRGAAVIAPWERPASSLDLPDSLSEHLSRAPLFDPKDPDVNRKGISDNDKTLFTMWKGLRKMQSLAEFAATDKRADVFRTQLDKQFARYEQEVMDFVSKARLQGIDVLAGPLKSEIEATSRIPRSRSTYEGRLLFSGTDQELTGIGTMTRFDINITKSDGSSHDIAIDLDEMGTTPKTLANIVNHVNTQLETAEVTTRFRTNRDEDGRYGLKIERSILETVTLSPVDAESAVYVAGTSGDGVYSKASLRKFTDLAGTPVQAFDAKTEATDGTSQAWASALGPNGEVYALGTTTGDIDGLVVGGEQDVFLTRYDAAGNEVWRRLVGASGTADGYGLAVAADGSIAIAGKADAPLTPGSPDNGINSFVTLFDSDGETRWTRNTGPLAPDAAFSVAFDDASGDVVVAGTTAGALSGQTHNGGQDAWVSRLSAGTGSLVEQVQFGDTGAEAATAVTVKDGTVYVAGNDDGQAFLRSYTLGSFAAGPVLDTTFGGIAETTRVAAIAVDDSGRIYLAGDTTDAGFTGAGLDGRQAHGGASDAYVARFDATTGAMDFGAYLGGSGADRARGLALAGGEVVVVGDTTGSIGGNTLVGSRDAFLARLDSEGVPLSTTTMTGINGRAELHGVAVDPEGDSLLTRLGLGHGDIGDLGSLTVASTTAVRPGMTFALAVGDGPARSIEIEADDSIRWLAFQVNRVLGRNGIAEVKKDGLDAEYLKISARDSSRITLKAGNEGFDALPGLGMRETTIYGPDVKKDDTVFALGFGGFVNLQDKKASKKAMDHMGFTLQQIEKAATRLEEVARDPLAKRRQEALAKPAPAHLQKQIASYQAALTRLTGGQG